MLVPDEYTLVAGVDASDDNYIRVAFLDSLRGECSYTENLHRYRNLRALHRRWWVPHEDGAPVAAAVLSTSDVGLARWFEDRHIQVHTFQPCQMYPFLQEARELEVPRRFRLAHALARCTATKLTAYRQLHELNMTFSELTFLLRNAQAGLARLTSATSV